MRRLAIFTLGTVIILGIGSTLGCERNRPDITAPAASGPAAVQTLVDLTTGLEVTSGGTGTFNWAGQSFAIPGGGSFNHVRFHWYTFQRGATAFGNLYLLDREYLGVPGALGASTPGFIARSERVDGGAYVFAPAATLNAGARYWVYTDAQGSFAGSFDTDIYTGGDMYVTGFPTNPFRKAPASGRMVNGVLVPAPAGVFVDANFKLQASAK